MEDHPQIPQLPPDPDDQPSTLIIASDELVESLKQAALKQDDQAYRALQNYKEEELQAACDEVTSALCERLYKLCANIPLPEIPEDDDDHSRLSDILPIVYGASADPETLALHETLEPILTGLQWTRQKYVDIRMPHLIEQLQKIAEKYLSPTATYAIVREYQELVRNMLLAAPNALTTVNVDPQFIDDLRDFFRLTPRETDVDYTEFTLRALNRLYYVQLLYDLVIAVKDFKKDPNVNAIDQVTLWQIAPDYLRQIALANDQIWRSISLTQEPTTPPPTIAQPEAAPPISSDTPLDIA